jgi:hypothetical protein
LQDGVITTIHPTPSGSAWAIIVGLFSLLLLAIGFTSLLGSEPQLLRALAAGGLGAYGLFNVLQTPTSLGVSNGTVVLGGLLKRRAQARELDRVELERGGLRRPWVWRFFLKEGGVAFETDAGLWDQAKLRELLKQAGVRVVPA